MFRRCNAAAAGSKPGRCRGQQKEKEGKIMIGTDKIKALENYKAATKAYLQDMTEKNWIAFCDAKKTCMLLGIRI